VSQKRLRIFAGPNGSGKSSLLKIIPESVPLGYYINRVKTRVIVGGHDVPEDKIRERYTRSLDLLYDALKVCYKSYLFDNSDKTIEIARIDRDKKMYILVPGDEIPNWMIKYVLLKSGEN
jgi:predicted ABC-type ATPase